MYDNYNIAPTKIIITRVIFVSTYYNSVEYKPGASGRSLIRNDFYNNFFFLFFVCT